MTTPLTPDDLARLAELLAAGAPGPWQFRHGVLSDRHGYYITRDVRASDVVCRMDGSTMAAFNNKNNADLIVAMHSALPALLAMARDGLRYRALRDSQDCSLSLAHNDHHNMYQALADLLDPEQDNGYYEDVPEDQRAAMIAADSIWTLHVYPNTPVGFNVYHGATLDAAIDEWTADVAIDAAKERAP